MKKATTIYLSEELSRKLNIKINKIYEKTNKVLTRSDIMCKLIEEYVNKEEE